MIDAARARRMTMLTSAEFAPQLHADPTPPKTSIKPQQDAGEAADVHVSPDEVEAWLKIFKDGK